MQKPLKRSKFRLWLGIKFYKLAKGIYWYFSGTNFAQEISRKKLKYEVFIHKTPLLRQLKDVDMYLQYNKIENLKIASKKLDGLVVEPGQIFSYWRQIGEPNKKEGYKEGMVLYNGKFMPGIGGGLCQLSNLIYWITLHSPLTVVERWRHGYDVFPDAKRTQPFGSGATCAYPAIDLQIRNDTKEDFQLKIWLDDNFLYGGWFSNKKPEVEYEIFESDHRFELELWGGYTRKNKIFRKIFNKKTGKLVKTEFITENNALMMYNPMIER